MVKKNTNYILKYLGVPLILVLTVLVYLNHFDNPFFFDDTHTISNNESIRSLDNWTTFFTDADTFSSLPANRSYRPMVTLKNAIDYKIGGGLDAKIFHYHIFFWFLLLIVLVFILSKRLYQLSQPTNSYITIIALFSAVWFALHTANAETINYICARSDSFSTLCIVGSLLLYRNPIGKKFYLYLITAIIGIWTKQTGVMFLPILFIYILLFEEYSILDNFRTNTKEKIFRFSRKIAPTAIIVVSLFLFNQYYLTPEATVSTNYTITRFEYISTQFFVIMHYLGNFILPINLSADPDISIIKPWYDIRIITGFMVIVLMVFIMVKTSFKKELRPISFGIAWFFIALLPTTLNPLFQIANDHRVFFPFIGLFIAVPWTFTILSSRLRLNKRIKNYHYIVTLSVLMLLIAHAFGTYQRIEVWGSKESLWKDVTIKSPKNGRGLMNYGETQMSKGNYNVAEEYFKKAFKLVPNYVVLHINFGILYGALNDHIKAKQYFESAIALKSSSPSPEYYYARYLSGQRKYKESERFLRKALAKSPNHILSKQLLEKISGKMINPEEEIKILTERIKTNPNPENYLNLSLKYYEQQKYALVINTCKELLKIDPNNALAYNNICSSYNQLKQWKLGAEACKKALEIKPNYQLAKNNLKWSLDNIN
ncbi:tetratricopeptide repeat protein [Aquimarina sp. M1]